MTSSHSKPLLIILSLISIILIAVLVLGVYSIRAKNEKTSELLHLVDQASEIKILSQSIRTVQTAATEEIKVYNDLILSNNKLIPLIEEIEESGRALGLDINILSVGEEEAGIAGLRTVRLVIETQGSWPSSLSFVRVVESLPHRVLINEVVLSKEGEGWRSKIGLALYLFD